MAEPDRFVFSHREVVEALIRQQGLHEGIWQLYVEFGIAGVNVGPDDTALNPAAVVPVVKLGLTKTDQRNNLSADAEEVNPKRKARSAKQQPEAE